MSKVALITGGSRGLGNTLAAFLAGRGYDLIITARHSAELETAATALRGLGVTVDAVVGDVADPAHRRALAATVERRGRLDLLINNASILGPSPQPALAAYPLEMLEQVFAVNVLAPLALIQELLPVLHKTQGLIVNLSSDAAVGAYAGWGGYGATKAALDLMSATLAAELAEQQVAVVVVDPGDMRTTMHQAAFPDQDISDRPLPEVTLPFWAWLFVQPPAAINGRRFQAQAQQWVAA